MWKNSSCFFNRRALPQTASEINQKINDNELFAPFLGCSDTGINIFVEMTLSVKYNFSSNVTFLLTRDIC